MKSNNICIIGIPERGEEEDQEIENLYEKVIMENFPNMMRPTSKYIIIKMTKFQDKEMILKAAREKQK